MKNPFSAMWDKIVDRGASLISEFITDKDKAIQLEHEFRMAMSKRSHDYRTLMLQVERDQFESQQETIQAELHQTDLYTKRTRPKIARQSWYITAAYAFATSLIPVLPEAWGLQAPDFQWQIFLILASPALTYMGVRGFEKWSAGSSK
ncbi:3TM-type holin [Microbulbifer sp. 2201CG32-9]|uniref:3TM-type holin n=1 Tax=Microbulbifer sp. 2201CG32-9 TaxID=3232309 RepID=UPI00345B527C